jgi:hypothetical protein
MVIADETNVKMIRINTQTALKLSLEIPCNPHILVRYLML